MTRKTLHRWALESPGQPLRVTCLECSKKVALSVALSDPEGTPFVAYYCEPCAAAKWPLRREVTTFWDGAKVAQRTANCGPEAATREES